MLPTRANRTAPAYYRLFFVSLLYIGLLSATSMGKESPHVNARIDLGPDSAHVTYSIPGLPIDTVKLSTSDWAGVPDYDKYISGPQAVGKAGELLPIRLDSAGHWSISSARKPFQLSYWVHCDRKSFAGTGRDDFFHAALFSRWAFLWGYSCFLIPEDSALAEIPVSLKIQAGSYGVAWTNLEISKPIKSFEKLSEGLITAGNYRHYSRSMSGADVTFLIQDTIFAFSDTIFVGSVSQILQAQARYIGFYPLKKVLVVLTAGEKGNSGGTVSSGAIAMYPDPTVPLLVGAMPTLRLISHEHFHVFNDQLHPPDSVPEGYYKWFQEGFTEYYAYLTLYREGLMSDTGFVNALNKLLEEYWTNPFAMSATLDTLAVRYWDSQDYTQLPYSKGALSALLIDLKIHNSGKTARSIDDYMRAIEDTLRHLDGVESMPVFQISLERITGRPWDEFLRRFVIGADTLPFTAVLAPLQIECATQSVTIFDLGFKTGTRSLTKNDVIVTVDSAAATAGMQVGDTLTGWSYYGKNMTKPAEIACRRSGKALRFTYLPVKTAAVPQIMPSAATLKAISFLKKTD